MKSVILKKLLSSVIVIFLLTILVFLIVHLLPGDPITVMLGENAGDPEMVAIVMAKYNLDKPLPFQYFAWLKNVLKGDFGTSLASKSEIMPELMERLPRTLVLCLIPMLFSLAIAIVLGIVSASHHNSNLDLGISVGSLAFLSVPEFWTGILLMLLFAVELKILPAGGYKKPSAGFAKYLKYMVLPFVTMILHSMPSTIRMVRSSMLEVISEDYMMLARTKGCSNARCNYVHGLRNSLVPIATNLSLTITSQMAGVIVIEKVFQYPGTGLMLLTGITNRDYPVVQACILVFSIIVVVINLLTDLAYVLIDPRIRYK